MAPVDITLVSSLWIVYTVGALALAGILLRAGVSKRSNAALFVLMLQQAIATGLSVLLFTTTDPSLVAPTFRLLVPVWLLWGPIVFLCAPLLLEGSAGRSAWTVGLAGALPGVALVAAGLWDAGFWLDASGARMTSWASAVFLLVFVGFAAVVVLLGQKAMRTDLPMQRARLGLLAAAFGVEGGYHAVDNVAKLSLGLEFHGVGEVGVFSLLVSGVPLVVLVAFGVWISRFTTPATGEDRRFWARVILGVLVASGLTGAAASGVAVAGVMEDPVGAFHVVWDLVALALIAYAGVRFQLFGIELKAKRSVAISSALGLGFVVFTGVRAMLTGYLAGFFEQVPVLASLPMPGVVATLVTACASIPLSDTGKRLAARVFPDVVDDEGYKRERSEEIYRAALEGVLADGLVDAEDAQTLRALREKLGISVGQHREMLEELGQIREKEQEDEAKGEDEEQEDEQGDGEEPLQGVPVEPGGREGAQDAVDARAS